MKQAGMRSRDFVTPLLVLTGLGTLGAASLLLTLEESLSAIPPIQIAAAGGRTSLAAALVLQPLILVIIASVAGLVCAPRLGLRSWIVDRLRKLEPARVPVLQSVATGAALGIILVGIDAAFGWLADESAAALRDARAGAGASLLQGLLYGGITEEIIVRWGLLSIIAAGLVKVRVPFAVGIWIAIVVSSGLFSLGHLPALAATVDLDVPLVVRTLLLNVVAGITFGTLFLRWSLESAMLAHMTVHLVFFSATVVGVA
ncbi:CPBP family intramembrane glutamic endopeptidase [Sphingomonas sp.]|jgi:hypothetical protein|uniref:CPBP family intramembrane glutamic endopeptidase n=1 Tax=Sphingomonas sp. TaxID=28214 RepID=UPI002DE45E6A|nr:CPBP family intramembrane glutamic endopeptidase [Sphingomonas sp.]